MSSATTITATVDRVVDGDTLRVFLPESDPQRSEALRILCLDTEEIHQGSKPATKMGRRASERAQSLFRSGDEVKLSFPGSEPVEQAMQRYRGNFGRLLVYLQLQDGRDFQELMIEEGFSPYFTKYGHAHDRARHERYIQAERSAQANFLGIWDQEGNNGGEKRNYASLHSWWSLRGRVIDEYRSCNAQNKVLNSRLDFEELERLAKDQQEASVFMELRRIVRISPDQAVITTGSQRQPYQLLVPDFESKAGQQILNLVRERYIYGGESAMRRGYAYIRGNTKIEQDGERSWPSMVVQSPDQIQDTCSW